MNAKYAGRVHSNPNSNDPKFLGVVFANTIADLKENARSHARSWNKHGYRLSIECENTGRYWIINS